MALASTCGYPRGYFDCLDAASDEELEMERNDVRDLLRTVTCHLEVDNESFSATSSPVRHQQTRDGSFDVGLQILARVMSACHEAIVTSSQHQPQNQVLSETTIHAFSALAKPLNQIGRILLERHHNPSEWHQQCLRKGLSILSDLSTIVVEAFHQPNICVKEIFPLSRLVDIAIASLSPMLASLSSYAKFVSDSELAGQISHVLSTAIHCCILSLEYIPELFAPSLLEYSMFDIRGAMRGPGGEDHVGCLALLRLASEDDCLTQQVVVAMVSYVPRLGALLQEFQRLEYERGKGVNHGDRGVVPQSRRILINILCQLELKSEGKLGADTLLQGYFESTINTIIKAKAHDLNENTMYHIAESTFDLASLTPEIIQSLFVFSETTPQRTLCLEAITTVCIHGYSNFEMMNDETIIQVR
jgi:hypothetical protein